MSILHIEPICYAVAVEAVKAIRKRLKPVGSILATSPTAAW